jgi:ubiquinone/menaquinone biosynthesis C-methylase UbiE
VAAEFVRWLDASAGGRWLDVGCGTGAVTDSVLRFGSPAKIVGLDPSEGYVLYARAHVTDSRAGFVVGTATALPVEAGEVDVAISGLVLNFPARPRAGVIRDGAGDPARRHRWRLRVGLRR